MILTPRGLLEHSRTEAGRRMIRYATTSAIMVVLTQISIVVFVKGFDVEAVPANLSSTMLVSIPAFFTNKYWVWGKSGRARIRREVIPFWVFTVAGWALSTGAVWIADNKTKDDTLFHLIAVLVASIAGFGVLWVLKYLFLDKLMFGPDHHTPYDDEFEIEEAIVEARPVSVAEAPPPPR